MYLCLVGEGVGVGVCVGVCVGVGVGVSVSVCVSINGGFAWVGLNLAVDGFPLMVSLLN